MKRLRAAFLICSLAAAPQQRVDPALPSYVPRPAAPPQDAACLLRDGSVAIVGYNDMTEIFAGLNALFVQSHPGVKFKMQLKGTATAAPALTLGVSVFAPMGAEFSWMELAAYRSVVGADPVPIRIAHCSLNPHALSAPVGIFVNRQNPIQKLTMEQVARIFSSGNSRGEITHWGQAGLTGDWAARSIHPCGIAEEAAAGLAAFMVRKMGGRPFPPAYESFAQSSQVIRRVGEDPAAIGFASANLATPATKLVAIAERAGGGYYSPTASNVMAGNYPYDRYLLIYLRRLPGEPIDPFVKEYLRMVLSKEGQQAIAAAPPNYLPLSPREVKAELAKLDRPIPGIERRGSDGSEAILAEFNKLFVTTHPGFQFTLSTKGLPAIALYGIITGKSPLALVDREIWPLEARPFRQTFGYDPTDVRIGRVGYSAPGRNNPPGIYVNAKNALAGLTIEQVARIFTTAGNGDISRWEELGMTGEWMDRVIHIYGPRDDGGFASAIRHAKMSGFPFASRYEPLSTNAEIMRAVAADQYGIALMDSCDAQPFSQAVKMLPLANRDGAPFSGASYEEVLAGLYPLSPYVHLYMNCVPGKPCDSLVKEYARLALSSEGQAVIAAQKDVRGYVPLSPNEVAEESTKLR